MRCAWLRIIHPICAFTPMFDKNRSTSSPVGIQSHSSNRYTYSCFCFIFILSFCNRQVSEEWFKHMLVWTR